MVVVSPATIVLRCTVHINTGMPQYHLRCYTKRQPPRIHTIECYSHSEGSEADGCCSGGVGCFQHTEALAGRIRMFMVSSSSLPEGG